MVFRFGSQMELVTFNVAAEAYALICHGLTHLFALMLKLLTLNHFSVIINEGSAPRRGGQQSRNLMGSVWQCAREFSVFKSRNFLI